MPCVALVTQLQLNVRRVQVLAPFLSICPSAPVTGSYTLARGVVATVCALYDQYQRRGAVECAKRAESERANG